MHKIAAIALFTFAVLPVLADEPRPPAMPPASSSTPEPPAAPAAPTTREQFLAVAARIAMRDDARAVEKATTELGSPVKIGFDWCNGAGCVNDVGEGRATRMTIMWANEKKEGEKRYSLIVGLCGGLGSWQVGNVVVYESDPSRGAFGTAPKPVTITRKVDESFFFGKCWTR